jgi:hypothetical protein
MKWIISVLLIIAFVAPAQAQAPPQSKGIGPCQSTAAKNPGVSVPGEVGVCPLPVAKASKLGRSGCRMHAAQETQARVPGYQADANDVDIRRRTSRSCTALVAVKLSERAIDFYRIKLGRGWHVLDFELWGGVR